MDLEKNKQRLEILAAEVEELKNSGGGGGDLSDYLTKAEASSTYETQSSASSALALKADVATTYTKTEVDEAIAAAAGGDYISKNYPIIGGSIEDNSTVDSKSIAIGYNNGSQSGYLSSSIVLGQCNYGYNSSFNQSIVIGASEGGYPSNTIQGGDRTVVIGQGNTLKRATCSTVIGQGITQGLFGLEPQLFYSTILGSFPKITNTFVNSIQRAFIVGTGEGGNNYNNTVEVKGENALRIDRAHLSLYNGADISFTGDSEFKVGSDTNSYDLRYFAPADETLADGGTISATALANALKHVPLSFNAHLCYYSYEDTNNVYYVSTRLNGTSLHTNVVAINKTTGVATFNEFDQS